MAKTAPTRDSSPKQPTNAIPTPTDGRAEMFYILGVMQGQGDPLAKRLAELVIEQTAQRFHEGTTTPYDSESA